MKSKQAASVPQAHREATFYLMEVFGMDIGDAYRYLKSAKFNIDNAIKMKLGPDIQPGHEQIRQVQFKSESHQEPCKTKTLQDSIGTSQKASRKNINIDEHVDKKIYNKTYLIKKNRSTRTRYDRRKKNQEDKIQKIQEEFDFVGSMSKLIEGQVPVSFLPELYDVFSQHWEQRKLVAIHCIKFIHKQQEVPPEIMSFTKEIYCNPIFVETFNKYLINFGLDPSHFDLNFYPFMKEFIEEGDQYSIIILNYNEASKKIELVKKLPFCKSFKLTNPNDFQNIIKNLQKNANANKYKPEKLSRKEKKQLQEDRLLRQQQQIQYFKQLNATQDLIEKPCEIIEKEEKEDISQTRRKKRQLLTIYPQNIQNAINFKVRLPNSESIYFKLPRTQMVQYIFMVIQNHQKDLGFIDESIRKFDILVPLERLSLSDKKTDTFESIFGQSQMEQLAVKQL